MQLVSAANFKSLVRAKTSPKGLGLYKQMIAPVEPVPQTVAALTTAYIRDLDHRIASVATQMTVPVGASVSSSSPRALRFTISTGTVDREQDRIALAGWDLANFQRNPVVLWGHDASRLPIGRAFDIRIEDAALKASVEFIPSDTPEGGPFAEAVYRLARTGFIAATSVGFRPIKWEYTRDQARGADDWFPGIDFEQQELVELSVVTVPANPEALVDAPGPGEGTAIANDTPPETGEEITSFDNSRARRRRVFLFAQAGGVVPRQRASR